MRCNIRSVKSTLRSVRPLNDPYGSNELYNGSLQCGCIGQPSENSLCTFLLLRLSTRTRIAKNKTKQNKKKKTCCRFSDHFICFCPISALFFLIIEPSVLIVLVFYYKLMLEKVWMQETQQFSDLFVKPIKNRRNKPVKCSVLNACWMLEHTNNVHSWKSSLSCTRDGTIQTSPDGAKRDKMDRTWTK